MIKKRLGPLCKCYCSRSNPSLSSGKNEISARPQYGSQRYDLSLLVFTPVRLDDDEMKYLLLIALIFFFEKSIYAESFKSPTHFSNVRVRLFKDLNLFPEVTSARIKPLAQNIWALEGDKLEFQNKKLSHKNFIFKNDKNHFDIIGIYDFNSYLAGVVSKEMPLSWPLEALKAQAVIARSFALARISERKNKMFHLDTDQMDQVFAMTNSQKAQQAVQQTENIVLKDQKNKILKAFYHADCGGQTVPASQVWPDAIDSGTAVDPWCSDRKANQWSFEVAKKDFYQVVAKDNQADSYAAISVNERFKGRIQSLKILGEIFSIQKLRQLFGFSLIKNSALKLTETDDSILLSGKGFGHGVGLCQWGSLAQARLGRSYIQILEHYYPQAQITNPEIMLSKNFLSDLVFN